MSQRFIKPAKEDLVIPRPDQQFRPLAKDGEWVADSLFWRRRIADGDCIEVEPVIEKASTEGEDK